MLPFVVVFACVLLHSACVAFVHSLFYLLVFLFVILCFCLIGDIFVAAFFLVSCDVVFVGHWFKTKQTVFFFK